MIDAMSEAHYLQTPRSVPVNVLRQFVESIGFDPDDVESVSITALTVTVVTFADAGPITITLPVKT